MPNKEVVECFYLRADPSSEFFVEDKNYEVTQVKGMRNGLKKVDEIFVPLLIKNLDLVKQMRVKPDDTLVIGFPKSGIFKTIYLSSSQVNL
jgi:hypothetical protein